MQLLLIREMSRNMTPENHLHTKKIWKEAIVRSANMSMEGAVTNLGAMGRAQEQGRILARMQMRTGARVWGVEEEDEEEE